MDVSATVTSKGQVTIPRDVREALGLRDGDRVLFRVVDGAALLARIDDLLDMAGTIPIPASARGRIDQERERAHRAQADRNV